jgi:hypothetical protein
MPLSVRRLPLEDMSKISEHRSDVPTLADTSIFSRRRETSDHRAQGVIDRFPQGVRWFSVVVHGSARAPYEQFADKILWIRQRAGAVIGWRRKA